MLQLINNFRQDLLNKNLVEPSIDNGVHEMKHNQELMVREGDEKLWIINIEPQVLVILESSSQPEKDCDLLIFIHPKGNIYWNFSCLQNFVPCLSTCLSEGLSSVLVSTGEVQDSRGDKFLTSEHFNMQKDLKV